MSQNAELQVALKANADQLLATIKQVTGRLDQLSAKINSLPTGDKQLNKLSREFARTSITQQNLIKSFDRLGTEAEVTAPKIEKTVDASKNARTAITSLSLAVQDLPFGFIGVQNNLPGIIQGFGTLTTATNGKVLPALKLLGQTLIGPAGIFLAFSAVTSIVTSLIQNYGSLGNAINALLGVQKSLNTEISDFNKEYDDFIKKQQTLGRVTQDAKASQEGQIAVVNSLAKKSTDLTLSQKEQKNALEELKKVDKDYFGNLVFGVSTVEDIRKAVQKYNTVLIAKSKIEAYKDEISSTQSLIEENKRLKIAQDSVVESDKKRSFQGQVSVGIGNEIVANVFSQNLAIRSNKKEQDNLGESNKKLQKRVDELKKLIDDQNTIIAANSSQFIKAGNSVKNYFESYKPSKEYLDFFESFTDEKIYDKGVKLFNELSTLNLTEGTKSVQKFNEIFNVLKDNFPNYFNDISVSADKELPAAIKTIQDRLGNGLKELELEFMEAEKSATINNLSGKLLDAYIFNTETLKQKLKEAKKEIQKSFSEFQPYDTSNIAGKGPGSYEKVFAPLIKTQEEVKKQTEKIVNTTRDAANLIGDVFFAPLQEQFTNLLTTGKFSLQEFSKVVLDNLKALVAKIIATGIVTLLATIFTGGFSSATFAATKLTGFQIFGKAFAGALGFGGTSSANFGGVNPSGLAMTGAVSLSLRGSDLVGAINRTNTNISRIG